MRFKCSNLVPGPDQQLICRLPCILAQRQCHQRQRAHFQSLAKLLKFVQRETRSTGFELGQVGAAGRVGKSALGDVALTA